MIRTTRKTVRLTNFEGFSGWNKALAEAFIMPDTKATLRKIGDGLCALFEADAWYIIFFRPNEPPILFDYIDADTRRDTYEDGPYLLDPFYQAYLRGDPDGVTHERDISPKNLAGLSAITEYCCDHFGPMEEFGLAADIRPDKRAFYCISRKKTLGENSYFTRNDVTLLECIAPILRSQLGVLWDQVALNGRDTPYRIAKHSRITNFFTSFGRDRLTEREAEVGNLMIKGFNARDVASFLDISYGTARNHMKKIYLKLKVSSQNELCGLFIEQLLSSSD